MPKTRIDRVSVFAECDTVAKDLPNEKITSRLIGSRMGVSQTAVYKLVGLWREEEKTKQEDLVSKTQMSSKFVTALLSEVDARVTEMRQLDEKERLQMSQEMDEMAEQVGTMESDIQSLREQLEEKTKALATANERLEQATASLTTAQNDHAEQTEQLQLDHKSAIESLKTSHEETIEKLETQNKELSDKLDAKGVELQGMTKDFAKAQVKAEAYDGLSKELTDLKTKAENLVGQNATLKAKEEATAMTIANLEASNADNITQRNNAQEALAQVNTRLTDVQNALQTKTLECVSLETTLKGKESEAAPK
ncbi:hypothetical protein AB4148_00710 [Vibrio sp. 10N.286.51.F4]|uniref:hypothetical protein n=1 Tax=Vibrio sp. 10N.286.51.F4 TaxID=3229710 RepID=UPI00354C8FA4